VAHMGDRKVAYKVSMGKPKIRRPLGRPRRRWEDIKSIFKKWYVGVWAGLIWLRLWTGGGRL
jgi:hypothetical protein